MLNQAAIDLLDSWLDESESASEHQQAWEFLKIALEKIDYPIVHYSHEPSDSTGFWATGNVFLSCLKELRHCY